MLNFFRKKNKQPKNLKQVLKQFKDLEDGFEKLSLEFESLKKEHQFSVQKVGMVRFNPFSEAGGNQSFSIALLDGKDNGLIVTSFYSRDGNRVYGKPIRRGNSEYALSREETKAIELAKKHGDKKTKNNQAADRGGSGSY